MKILFMILFFLYAKSCLSIGWEEVLKEGIEIRDISVDLYFNNTKGCNEISASFPNTLFFQDLGNRGFSGIEYMKIEEKSRGWQLNSKGTKILLHTSLNGNYTNLKNFCLSDVDLKSGYLSAYYSGIEGQIPMVLLINLSDFK